MALSNRDKVIIRIFERHYHPDAERVYFSLDDIREAIHEVDYEEKNVADLRYQYTSGRSPLPSEINRGGHWMIAGAGKGRYAFVRLKNDPKIVLPKDLMIITLPDATPEIVLEYAGGDEQGLLARALYNRLIDCFLGLTCYHIQNHWRTFVKGEGQREVDDLYIGLDKHGRHYVIPVEAKSKKDRLSKTQIAQMISFALARYPDLICRPVGIKEEKDGSIYLIEFVSASHPDDIAIADIKRYKLVPMDEVEFKTLKRQTD